MIQIELPCCDAPVELPRGAKTVRCERCAIEHLLAEDARATHPEVGRAARAAAPAPTASLAA